MLQTPQVTNKNKILDLIAWMRTHDPAERYDWCSGGNCLIAQYSKHLGLVITLREYPDLCGGDSNYGHIARGVWPIEDHPVLEDGWTFGQAISRAEELLADVYRPPN